MKTSMPGIHLSRTPLFRQSFDREWDPFLWYDCSYELSLGFSRLIKNLKKIKFKKITKRRIIINTFTFIDTNKRVFHVFTLSGVFNKRLIGYDWSGNSRGPTSRYGQSIKRLAQHFNFWIGNSFGVYLPREILAFLQSLRC